VALSLFETEGTWRRIGGGLVHLWSERPEFIPSDLDVPFWFGQHYNWGMPHEEQEAFLKQYRIVDLFEIVEVFNEPYNDVDPTFKGRQFLVACFTDAKDAIYFRMCTCP